MIKYFTALRPFIGPIFLFIFFSCGPKPPVTPAVDEAKLAAEKANKEFIAETGEYTEVEKDPSSVEAQVTGKLDQPTEELTRTDVEIYKTGEPGWIKLQKKKRFSDDMTRPQAKENLLRELRNDAVNKKVGTTVEVTQLLTDVMSATGNESFEQSAWSGFFRSTVSGVITDERQEKNEIKHFNEGEGFELDLEYSFYVQPVTGQRDPGFWLDSELENDMLKEGGDLVIRLRPSKDAYVYIFNLMADNNAMLMFPNDYMKENFISAGEELVVPDPKIQKYVSFIVGTMPGQKLTSESVYIICTKQKVPVIESLPRIGQSIQVFSGNSKNFIELQRWLTGIPLDQRVERALLYHVSK
jgi:hypothetical protein